MSSQFFAADGCMIPNIHTQDYRITLAASCEHGKIRSAEIVISATSEVAAIQYAETWLRQGVLRPTVVASVEVAA